MMKKFFLQLFIAIDQVFNVIVWSAHDGFGMADETISARSWRHREHSSAYVWINKLFFWQANHCRSAYESEVMRKHLPSPYRHEADVSLL